MADSTDPIVPFGKEISYCDTANGEFTAIAKTQKVTLPEAELGKAESTHDGSPDAHKEYLPTLYEPGTMKVTYEYTAAQFAVCEGIRLLATDAATRASATKFWKVLLPDGSAGLVKGFITKHAAAEFDLETVPTVDIEIQCSGKMTFTAGQGS